MNRSLLAVCNYLTTKLDIIKDDGFLMKIKIELLLPIASMKNEDMVLQSFQIPLFQIFMNKTLLQPVQIYKHIIRIHVNLLD